jgi:hypothetical protein
MEKIRHAQRYQNIHPEALHAEAFKRQHAGGKDPLEVFVDEHGRPLISEKLPGDQNEMEKGAIKQLAQKVAAKYGNASART